MLQQLKPTLQRDPRCVAAVELGGVRTLLGVPMLKENELIGAFSSFRQEVRPSPISRSRLVTNFAAQAVIAIENARLLNELRQRTTTSPNARRPHRSARAADGYLRGTSGYQQLSRRSSAGVRDHAGECRAHL